MCFWQKKIEFVFVHVDSNETGNATILGYEEPYTYTTMPFYADTEIPHIRRKFVDMYVDIVQHRHDEDGNEQELIAQVIPTHYRQQQANGMIEGYVFRYETTYDNEAFEGHPCFLRKRNNNSEDENSEDENSVDREVDRVEVTVNLTYTYVDENDNVLSEDNSSSFFDNGAFYNFVYESFDFQEGQDDMLIAPIITMTSSTGVLLRIVGIKVFDDDDNEVGIAFQVLELQLAMNADQNEDDELVKIDPNTTKRSKRAKRAKNRTKAKETGSKFVGLMMRKSLKNCK